LGLYFFDFGLSLLSLESLKTENLGEVDEYELTELLLLLSCLNTLVLSAVDQELVNWVTCAVSHFSVASELEDSDESDMDMFNLAA